jgi:uracil-DNA glycosylase
MLNNCERHFQATLEILEPTIVVIQGIKVWKWSKNVLVPIKKRSENLFECDLAGRRVMVAAFTHPSAWGPDRWDSPTSVYFKQVVRPTLRRALPSSNGGE